MREDIKKRREKYNIETRAMKLFGGKDLITERKAGMNLVHFNYMKDIQDKALKKLFPKPSNPRIAKLMRSAQPSLHLQMEVAKRKALKHGWIEEVKPVKTNYFFDFFAKLFNYFRNVGIPQLV